MNIFEHHEPTVDPHIKVKPRVKAVNTAAALIAAALITGPQLIFAQPTAEAEDEQLVLEQVTVTGSRISRLDGYQDPTPVSVLSEVSINSFAADNIAEVLNTMPSFVGSTGEGNVTNVSNGTATMSLLNLRRLGTQRTLVLLDGRRVVPSTLDGGVDINTFPQDLVKQVEVVTGGASAVYGSDAVGGVVNFILDTKYTGLKADLSAGITDYGDRNSNSASVTGGLDFAGGRGHIIANVSWYDADAVAVNDRPWNLKGWQFMYNPYYTPTNGQPERILLDKVSPSDGHIGGIISSTPLRGTAFGEGGVPYQIEFGDLVNDPDMRGGDWKKTSVRGTRAGQSLAPDINVRNFFTHVSYQLTDKVEVFAEASLNRSETYNYGYTNECNGCYTITDDNPFIPASVAAQMQALGLTEFDMGTQNMDLGTIATDAVHEVNQFMVGAQGMFDALGSNWNWDVYYQRGTSKHLEKAANVPYMVNMNLALDAVRDPVSNEIVCRSTLTDPTNGCAPYNPMGINVNSQAAIDFIHGNGIGEFRDEKQTQQTVAATITGEPFSVPAGPVSVAAGVSYRKNEVVGVNDPISRVRGWYTGGYGVTNGSIDVSEVYAETVVPLLNDKPGAHSLNINGAVRLADYNLAGSLTTWKFGVTYEPVEGVRFRGNLSRDARAPNLSELFAVGGGGISNGTNPFLNDEPLILIPVPTTGNPNLDAELADSMSIGVVLQPAFLPSFSISVDYWEVNIEDAIATLPFQETIDRCYRGNASFCNAITFAPDGSQNILEVARSPFNYVAENSRGLDIEATYSVPVGNGDLQAHVLATNYLEKSTEDGIGPKRRRAGEIYLPDWLANASLSYSIDPFNVSLTARHVSSSVYDNRFIECTQFCPPSTAAHRTTSENDIEGQTFFDAAFSYRMSFRESGDVTLYLNVRNLLNSDPKVVAGGPGADGYFYAPNDENLYDYLGRVYKAGVRVNF